MITPQSLFPQVKQFTVTRRDEVRLAPHLASSGKLNELLVLDTVGNTDLRRMLVMEANRRGGPRYVIVRKLLARILSRERERVITTCRAFAK